MGVSKYSTAPALTPRHVPSRNVFGIRIRTGSEFNCVRDLVQDRGQKWSREETIKKFYVFRSRIFFQDGLSGRSLEVGFKDQLFLIPKN